MNIDYPDEWNQLPRHERRKKIKELRRGQGRKSSLTKKVRNWTLALAALVLAIVGIIQLTKKSPEQIAFEQQVEAVSLDGKVEDSEIEGSNHVPSSTEVEYKTNPPTSGDHLAEAKGWGVYNKEIDDKAGVHGLEHGGIWITYKNIDDETKQILEEIGKSNSQSVIVSPREANDDKIVVASWGKMMKLESIDKAAIQKYIDSNKNLSPEKIAR
ncbi:MAG: hypothetical protein COY80_05390 [Candidatus Pacebacteria bacterium CG_4_10_14_0_8_um_filter_42_14]|nr:MAG: hypothetical protein COY80_05390 [Candidatus Pacebacteria bacterium CG_4_10_14_0_8_um_filter_42_14]